MRDTLQRRCELYIQNRDTLRKTFKWDNSDMYALCANLFCARGKAADADELRRCNELLKRQTGLFSNFRGTARLVVVTMLAADDAPDDVRLADMLDAYDQLKKHFSGSQYLAAAALLLAETPHSRPAADVADRARSIYNKMRKEHPFLTGSDDSVLALLLALSDKDEYALIAEMEDCYQRLKPSFGMGDGLQGASHVLALAPGATLDKSARMIALYEGLRKAGRKYGKSYELTVLAALSILPVGIDTAVADMLDADAWLAAQPGYRGIFGEPRRKRLTHAAMLVADDHAPDPAMDAASMATTLAMIAAQQTATAAAAAT